MCGSLPDTLWESGNVNIDTTFIGLDDPCGFGREVSGARDGGSGGWGRGHGAEAAGEQGHGEGAVGERGACSMEAQGMRAPLVLVLCAFQRGQEDVGWCQGRGWVEAQFGRH